jgi:filamentous hemagglutinin
MPTCTQQRTTPRWVPFVLAALVAVAATIVSAATASDAATGGAKTRVGASKVVVEPAVEPPQRVIAGQQVVETGSRIVIVVATVVAANTEDDWPVLSGIVRDPAKGKGNYGLGSGMASQATRAGESWVDEGFRIASDGRTLVSRDGLRMFRPPKWKPNEGKSQAHFKYWIGVREGKPFGNGPLDITELGQ